MAGRSITEVTHLMLRLMKFYRDGKKDLLIIFIGLEMAYDRVLRKVFWSCLEKKNGRLEYIWVIEKDIYERVKTRVRPLGGDIENFHIDIGFYQGSVVSPFLFMIVMNELTKYVQDEVP